MSLPPRDSWIRVAPGASVEIDARLGSEWETQRRRCRELRGNVLAKSFELEYIVDQLITETLFPADSVPEDNRAAFDEAFLKNPSTGFRNKIEALRKLRAQLPRLQAALPEDVISRLNKVRDLRNAFAHYPVVFDVTGERPNQQLVAILETRRERFDLSDAFLREHDDDFRIAFSALEAAKAALGSTAPLA